MKFSNVLVSGAILSSAASAASTTKSIPSSCTINSSKATATAQTDLDAFSGCETLVGDLTITGDLGNAAIATVKKIEGSLKVFNATNLNTLAADALEEVTDSLILQQLTILYSASFGSLSSVDSIQLVTLPALQTFTSTLESASEIIISDTSLESIEGFSNLQTVSTFNINNNKYLTEIDSSLKNITTSLILSSNNKETEASFDDLTWANNITISAVASLSFESLKKVNASFSVLNNTIDSLDLSKLTTVGGSLSFEENNDLTSLDCKNLTTVGGALVIGNNTDLTNIDGFANVTTIAGALEVIGSFHNLDLSSLKSVKGGADIETTATNFTCSAIDKLHSNGVIEGDSYQCSVPVSSSSSSSSSSSTSASSSSTHSSTMKTSTTSGASSSSRSLTSHGAAVGSFENASFVSIFYAIAAVLVSLL
ncbi:hypothetical protein TPHA_0M01290 [Tetrapisispora phaffii CBS 4417]|uniref:Receptor L-domain domain-containing protein n=1 Tax=Tetrapisispora phaffii (strain ATCC 24235 / CBS 4417 / NBRC 1672 / NRRL Y-8282 / UCD 70-5) TaxID=1071381 RepID=G8C0I9_TETPH|nr:hypothetical protein TPHA_0M01290 [Tetrapisispora phaffii CBS 4417]CCE65704.1 hypothetical protein TPHA_0M01290 [Tetrapisispora phaffii CBS 4417]